MCVLLIRYIYTTVGESREHERRVLGLDASILHPLVVATADLGRVADAWHGAGAAREDARPTAELER